MLFLLLFYPFCRFLSFLLRSPFRGRCAARLLDPNGAGTPTAKLTLTDEATSVPRTTVSDEKGEYSFIALAPATYTVAVEVAGFKTLERKGVVILTQINSTLDLTLSLGQVSEQINVSWRSGSRLQHADGSTGQLIENHWRLQTCRCWGAIPYFEGQLAQGVVYAANPAGSIGCRIRTGNSRRVSIAGGPLRTNNYTVDGISLRIRIIAP